MCFFKKYAFVDKKAIDILKSPLYNYILYQNGYICLLLLKSRQKMSKNASSFDKESCCFQWFWVIEQSENSRRETTNGVIFEVVNVKPRQLGKNLRMSFDRINEVLEMPNLIEIQKSSYSWFLGQGLREVFGDSAAITDYSENLVLEFIDYRVDETPKYSVEECKERDVTYAAPLRVRVRCLLYTSRCV